jgi:hypothetical protein
MVVVLRTGGFDAGLCVVLLAQNWGTQNIGQQRNAQKNKYFRKSEKTGLQGVFACHRFCKYRNSPDRTQVESAAREDKTQRQGYLFIAGHFPVNAGRGH